MSRSPGRRRAKGDDGMRRWHSACAADALWCRRRGRRRTRARARGSEACLVCDVNRCSDRPPPPRARPESALTRAMQEPRRSDGVGAWAACMRQDSPCSRSLWNAGGEVHEVACFNVVAHVCCTCSFFAHTLSLAHRYRPHLTCLRLHYHQRLSGSTSGMRVERSAGGRLCRRASATRAVGERAPVSESSTLVRLACRGEDIELAGRVRP